MRTEIRTNDDRILDARDMAEEIAEARTQPPTEPRAGDWNEIQDDERTFHGTPLTDGLSSKRDCSCGSMSCEICLSKPRTNSRPVRPSTFITAEQARAAVKPESSHDVFKRIQWLAAKGDKECFVLWAALGPETMQLLGAGGYQVKRGGVDNEYAIITW